LRRESGVGGFAFCDTARGSKLGHHTRHIIVADLQPSLTGAPVFSVHSLEFRFSGLWIKGGNNEFSAHSRVSLQTMATATFAAT
jgi:hypothetical protein